MMQNQSKYSADDDLDQDPNPDYYEQYHYLQVPTPPSPGGPQYDLPQHHQATEAVSLQTQQHRDHVAWAQEEYLNVEAGDYDLPHPEELMLPPENAAEMAVIVNIEPAASMPTYGPAAATDTDESELPHRKPPSKRTRKMTTKQKSSSESTYVLRIHEMLEDAERKGLSSIVAWRPHGRAFKIFNEEAFRKDVLPHYFSAKIGSFRRWLRAWGFNCMREGQDRGCWYHRYFVRGAVRLCKDLSRQQMTSAMLGWPPGNPVPNFYSVAAEQASSEGASPPPSAMNSKCNPRLLRGTILEDLRRLLEDVEGEGNMHIASWQPHGKAFKIHDKGLFEGIMPRYFRTSLFSNLSDALRIWGFRRFRQAGPDKGCFYHKRFVRGQPALSRHVPRDEMRKAMADFPPPEGEPDLEKDDDIVVQTPPLPLETACALFAGQNSEQQESEGSTFTIPYYYDPVIQGDSPGDIKDDVGASSRTYVLLLHDMLEDAEKEGNMDIVCWMPHGRAWTIKKETEFAQKILPRYFSAQLKSFLRWCRAWGFARMTEGKDRGAWFHRYFIRGATSLCQTMSRQQMLKSMEGWLPPGHCPNFYSSWNLDVGSDARPHSTDPSQALAVKNPKRLRGTVPEDLRQMLEEAEEEGNAPIISWCKHGRAFDVHDKAAFTDHILPRYFKASKFTYFSDAIRQWGFRRFRFGPDKGAFYHKLFVRGKPELTRHLTRSQMNESMTPWLLAGGEPNFYDQQGIEAPHAEVDAMEDDDNNGPPLDADAIIAAVEQTEEISAIGNRPELSGVTDTSNTEMGVSETARYAIVGI